MNLYKFGNLPRTARIFGQLFGLFALTNDITKVMVRKTRLDTVGRVIRQ